MRRWTRWMLVFGVVLSCRKPPPEVPADPTTTKPEAKVTFQEEPTEDGLGMRLYEARPLAGQADAVPLAAATPLDDAAVNALLGRLPPLETDASDTVDFALREGPQPPPRTGSTVQVPFPTGADVAAPVVESGPLTVLRRAPEGEVPMAPHLSVTFSRPMIALSSQAEASKTVPVKLSPQPEGAWRWLGTKTLVFEPKPRFPMATRFSAEIPAGTRTPDGSTLAEAVSWSFATPPVTLQAHWPDDGSRRRQDMAPQPLSPVIFLGFDQAVSSEAVVKVLRLRGGTEVGLRLATKEEIAGSPEVAARIAQAEPGRSVVVTPTAPLARSTTYTVAVPVGTPSAEGPLLTTSEQSFAFRTFGPLVVSAPTCWNQKPCPPTSPWQLPFSNPLDLEGFDAAAITVTPEVPGLQVMANGNTVTIAGLFTGRTTYTVQVAAGIRDVFGQALAEAHTFTIDVGPAEQSLRGPDQSYVTVDPVGPPKLSFFTTNHKGLRVTIHEVAPTDWTKWEEWLQRYRWEDNRKTTYPGRRVYSGTIPVAAEADRQVETALDLSKYVKGTSGQLIVQVEPTVQPKERWARQEWLGWVQVTPLGLTVFQEEQALTVWATSLADGTPGRDVEVRTLGAQGLSEPLRTGADGLVRVPLADTVFGVVARDATGEVFLPASPYGYGGAWVRVDRSDELRWYVFDDKNLYKPGETVRVRGWLRAKAPGVDSPLTRSGTTKVRWNAYSSQGNPLGEGTASVSGLGGFTLELALPKTPNLGTARFDLVAEGGEPAGGYFTLPFEIQEYRTPEFEVTASGADGVYALGEDAVVDVTAAYYAGGGLPSAPVNWSVTATPASFVPPGRSEWSFGAWSPWWRPWSDPASRYVEPERLAGVTDGTGAHHLGIHFESLRPARPMTVTAEATVQDVNRQAWTASRSFLVHPADVYVGLKTSKAYVEAGTPIDVDAILVDRQGAAAKGTIDLVLRRLVWKRTASGWAEVPEEVAAAKVEGAGKHTFVPKAGGSYAIVATTRDGQARKNETELRVWVSGEAVAPDRGVAQEQVTLVPEKQSYAVGETATVLVQAPFAPAEGVLTVRAGGLLETRAFHMDTTSTTLAIPVAERHVPDFTVAVDLVGARARSGDDGRPRADLPKRVAYAGGTLTFTVPPLSRTLTVGVTPVVARLEPGGETSIDLVVTGADGKPVPGAELAVVAVDEAVLALTGYKLPDPLAAFYAARGDGVTSHHLREWVKLVDPVGLTATGSLQGNLEGLGYASDSLGGGLGMRGFGEGGGGAASGALMSPMAAAPMEEKAEAPARKRMSRANQPTVPDPGPKIAVRSDFSAVALWSPSVTTDASGKARVPLKLPDSLTRYRVMVVAVGGDRTFGSGEADVTARLPLMVRPSAPRFLNFGDRVELPVVLQNQTDAPLTVDLAVRVANLSLLGSVTDPLPRGAAAKGGQAGRRVTVPANDRVEVRFPAAAAMAGTARFQLAAVSGAYADAANGELPVWTPATTEAFATYGTFDTGAELLSVAPPPEVWPQFGGLEVTVSSTQLQALTDSFVYLVRYPYDCNEQIASRLLGISALRDVLDAFASDELPSKAVLEETVAADLERLGRRQNADGGWSFWRRGDPEWPYLGVHVTHALVRAEAKGYAIDPTVRVRALSYARTIESHIPAWYSRESRWAIRAYAVHVLSLAGTPELAKAKALVAEAGVDKLGAQSLGWLLPTLVDGKATKEVAAIRGWLQNHVTETAAGAHFVTSYSDGAQVLLHSDRVADGVLLEALLRTDPKNDLVPKLVNGLLAHRKAGRWANTTENAHVLLALDRYFHLYEGVTPAFVARVWLGDGLAGERSFEGRSTERAQIDVPMAWLQAHGSQEGGTQDLIVGKEGAGRLYYRAGLKYAPVDLDPDAADQGFAVERVYEPVDDPADVTRGADGVWTIKAGARVRVRLTMATPMRRYHVALVDPLPAGLEVQNPDLAVTGAIPEDPSAEKSPYWWWTRTWYEHENLRDERVEAFASLLWDGVHTYTYVARATTPGDFVVPPTKAEEMYSPETFGRSAGDRVVVR